MWDAGASITVGGKHIANWLIGQVRDKTHDENDVVSYAREIGADEEAMRKAFLEVPIMSKRRLQKIADALFVFANQLSTSAYQNIQQARFIQQQKQELHERNERKTRFQKQYEAITQLLTDPRIHISHPNVMIKEALKKATEILDVEQAGVWFFNADHTTLFCDTLYQRSIDTFSSGTILSTCSYPRYFETLQKERGIAADDAQNDPRTCEFNESYLKPQGITSMLDSAIWQGGEMTGILCLEHIGEQRTWKPEEVSFAGEISEFIRSSLDSHAMRKREYELLKSYEQLETLNQKLETSMEKANRTKSMFLADMSHEIRTPMNAIIGFCSILTCDDLTEEQADFVNRIHQSSVHLVELINTILDLSKIESGMLQMETRPCSLNELLESITTLLTTKAAKKKLDFQVLRLGELPDIIHTDPGKGSVFTIVLPVAVTKEIPEMQPA